MGLVVAKLGSTIVSDPQGNLRQEVLDSVCADVASLKGQGHQVVIVSSGAIARGVAELGLGKRPTGLDDLQAASAVGQAALFQAWRSEFSKHEIHTAQVLLTLHDIEERASNVRVAATLRKLLEWGAVPIINENDTTTTEEITFGDNDVLAAQVAILLGAERLVLLTEADGLHESDPRSNPESPLVSEVTDFKQLEGFNIAQHANELGSGGMRSKVVSAEMATAAGIETIVGPGLEGGTLLAAVSGESVGTRFVAGAGGHGSFKSWLRFAKQSKGQIHVDAGAVDALRGGGTSLLPVGVRSVEGDFNAGDAVDVVCGDDLIGKGLVAYSAAELRTVAGLKTPEVEALMPGAPDEAIHRDRFVLS